MQKNNGFIFPYGIKLEESGLVQIFPAAEIFFQYKNEGLISLIFLIDSGASISSLPKNDANVFGIDYKKGKKILISGINKEPMIAFKHELKAFFKNEMIKLPVVFIDSDFAPRVLGREGVFNNFTIIFEEKEKRTGFIKNPSSQSEKVKKIIDDLF